MVMGPLAAKALAHKKAMKRLKQPVLNRNFMGFS